jgi:hypothetical protein
MSDERILYWRKRFDAAVGQLPPNARYARLAAAVIALENVRSGDQIELHVPPRQLSDLEILGQALKSMRRKNQNITATKRLKKKNI